MRQSQLFTKTLKDAPRDEQATNAQLLIRAGYAYKEFAGVYAYLPLGLRVLEKIKTIIRQEMNAIDGQEIIMTGLQRQELWQKTDRWDDEKVDVWFKSQLKNGTEVGFGWSHEEPITDMLKQYITSYRDLPVAVYQFQTKLRNEMRAKSGILRGREFVMKDLYSYNISQAAHEAYYQQVTDAYLRVFDRVGLGADTFVTFAAGGAFTDYSHEFQTITDAGEDTIYINREKNIAINDEVLNDATLQQLGVTKDELEAVTTAEVGNIFTFGTDKCDQLGLTITGEDGSTQPVYLGSYGIGVTRLMGVLVERFHDDAGIIWPAAVAPYQIHLLGLQMDQPAVADKAEALYKQLTAAGIEVLFDDRADVSVGQKFAEADLIGLPVRLVVSEKSGDQIEYKRRDSQEATLLDPAAVIAQLEG